MQRHTSLALGLLKLYGISRELPPKNKCGKHDKASSEKFFFGTTPVYTQRLEVFFLRPVEVPCDVLVYYFEVVPGHVVPDYVCACPYRAAKK